jgi:hypothetical protein
MAIELQELKNVDHLERRLWIPQTTNDFRNLFINVASGSRI